MIKKLSDCIGVTGYEFLISSTIQKIVDEKKFIKYTDNIGNLIYYKKGISSKKTILISAHMDEVGLQINNTIDKNKLGFKVLGNIHAYNLYQQKVKFSNEAKGIILANDPMKLEKYNYNNLYIRLLNDIEVQIGDVCTFDCEYSENDTIIIGKALDNRIGCYSLIKVMEQIEEGTNDLYFVFSVQEEIGLNGITIALKNLEPDIAIVVDTVIEDSNSNIFLDKGVAIKISDGISICNSDIVNELKHICFENNIKHQLEVTDFGATEVGIVAKCGLDIKCGALSIPVTNIHTGNTIANMNDINECINLLSNYIVSKL